MQDQFNNDDGSEHEKSFAELLETYSPEESADLQVGDKVRGDIISIGQDTVFVGVNTKIDATVDKSELLDDDRQMPYSVGDSLELFVVAVSESELKLSRAISGIGGIQMLKEAYEKDVPVEGKVLETCKGGFRVEIMQRRAFCPISQIDLSYVENPDDYVGQPYQFSIIKFEENGKNIVVSRRELLAREQEKSKKEFYDSMALEMTLTGKVKRILPFGAFVEIAPGVEGMVHVSEMSWSKSVDPTEAMSPGETVQVKIIRIEPGKKEGDFKIALSVKQTGEDPWLDVADTLNAGDVVRGKITRCAPFGAFVEITPGIEGLVHISEMSYTKRVLKPEEIVTPGETVSVLIKEIDEPNKRISLSLKDAEGDPWAEVSDQFKVGQNVTGAIEKKEKFGYFVNLAPGITALLPGSNIKKSSNPASIEKLRDGDSISVIITNIDPPARKMTLAPGDLDDEHNWQSFVNESQNSMGSLGEQLQKAMASKKDNS